MSNVCGTTTHDAHLMRKAHAPALATQAATLVALTLMAPGPPQFMWDDIPAENGSEATVAYLDLAADDVNAAAWQKVGTSAAAAGRGSGHTP
jgi:hypothetical protein